MLARTIFTLALAILLFVSPLSARTNWQEDGTPVCIAPLIQHNPVTLTDGAGGAFVVWQDARALLSPQIYARHIDSGGNSVWPENGINICPEVINVTGVQLVPDGSGGIIVVWSEYRTGNQDLFAQRVTLSGTLPWGTGGRTICNLDMHQLRFRARGDGFGGAIVVWNDDRSGADQNIYAQRISTNGEVLWTPSGLAICTREGHQDNADAAPDGSGGGYIVWEDARTGDDENIYAQRLDGSGAAQWTADGIGITTAAGTQSRPLALPDADQGAFIVWEDERSSNHDIYAQRMAPNASPLWTPSGLRIVTSPNAYLNQLTADGTGGFLIAVRHIGSAVENYVHRVNPDGLGLWRQYLGNMASNFTPNGIYQMLVGDGTGGALVAWQGSDDNIWAQRIGAAGNLLWTQSGVVVCDAVDQQHGPAIATVGNTGEAFIAWEDYRHDGSWGDIYAQSVDPDGNWGAPAPWIQSAQDIPGDQGGFVNLAWFSSDYDDIGGTITNYSLWRGLDVPEGMAKSLARSRQDQPDGDTVRVQVLAGKSYFWELVDTHDAYRIAYYATAVPTLFDTTPAATDLHYFQVIAHTSDPDVFYLSQPVSGYSVDNLAPVMPAGLAGVVIAQPVGLQLSWLPNAEPDLDRYHVYAGNGADFFPSPQNLVASLSTPGYLDLDWIPERTYKVSATDIHDNESPFAVWAPVSTVPDPDLPGFARLETNYPNPFNPSTRIRFNLTETTRTKITIYDVTGRLVRSLLDESRKPGSHELTFDGRDARGGDLPSGVYYIRLTTGEFQTTRSMTLVR